MKQVVKQVINMTTETVTPSARAEMRSVLELLAAGTIDVDEALELLIALEDTPPITPETPTATRKARAVHITVERPEAQNINVTIPASLTKIALKLMPKDMREHLSAQGIDPDTVNQLLAGDIPIGRLLELTKDENGVSTRVTIDAS
jgi:hypothetical protein